MIYEGSRFIVMEQRKPQHFQANVVDKTFLPMRWEIIDRDIYSESNVLARLCNREDAIIICNTLNYKGSK